MRLKISLEIEDVTPAEIERVKSALDQITSGGELKETVVKRAEPAPKTKKKDAKKVDSEKIDLSAVMHLNIEVMDTFGDDALDIINDCCDLAGVKKINEIKGDDEKCEFCYSYLKMILKQKEVLNNFSEKKANQILDKIGEDLGFDALEDIDNTTTCKMAINAMEKKLND